MTLSTEMTPRARRMMVYCATGFLIYMLILFSELLQSLHLNRIDEQMKAMDRQAGNYDVDVDSPIFDRGRG